MNADIDLDAIVELLKTKGRICISIAYAEWKIVNEDLKKKLDMQDCDLIEVPRTSCSGKNGVDIKINIEIMKLIQSRPDIDSIVIIAGDSDYSHIAKEVIKSGRRFTMIGHDGKTGAIIKWNASIEYIAIENLAPNLPQEQIPHDVEKEPGGVDLIEIPNKMKVVKLHASHWRAILGAVETFMSDGEGLKREGSYWVMRAYIHNLKLENLPFSLEIPIIKTLQYQGLLVQEKKGYYKLPEDYLEKKAHFLRKFNIEQDLKP